MITCHPRSVPAGSRAVPAGRRLVRGRHAVPGAAVPARRCRRSRQGGAGQCGGTGSAAAAATAAGAVRELTSCATSQGAGVSRPGRSRLPCLGARTRVLRRARRPVRCCAVVTGAVIAAAVDPQAAFAASGPQFLAADSIATVISNLTAWIIGILAGVATLFLTIGGLRYLAAGGDPSEVEKAKTALKSAAIGYGLAVLAPVIVGVLKSLVGG